MTKPLSACFDPARGGVHEAHRLISSSRSNLSPSPTQRLIERDLPSPNSLDRHCPWDMDMEVMASSGICIILHIILNFIE